MAKTIIETIRASAYGFYFDKLFGMMPEGTDENALAGWWSKVGVYEYMRGKHDPALDMEAMFAELKQQATEALNG